MSLTNRLAIIVGGLGGIGTATAKLLRSNGSKLILLHHPSETDRAKPILKEVFNNPSSEDIQTLPCDITSPSSVTQAFSSLTTTPNILINTAGHVSLAPLETFPHQDIQAHYAINLLGPTLTSQAFAKLYLQAPSPKPPGRIINIASQAAHIALHHHGPYCASKAGLIGLTKCMASEWGGQGITANTISPGPVMTALGKKAWSGEKREEYLKEVPTGRFAEPEEVAAMVEFLCRDEVRSINGADIRIDGGFTIR